MSAARAIADEILDALAARLAADPAFCDKLRGLLAGHAPYSQENLPPGMSRRSYLEHCARRSWPNAKVGRLRLTERAAYEEWLASKKRPAVVKQQVEDVEEINFDPRAYLAKLGAVPIKRRA